MPTKVREALKILGQDGWVVDRQTGSHRQLVHESKPGTVTVAGKESKDLSPKMWSSILRQAGLK